MQQAVKGIKSELQMRLDQLVGEGKLLEAQRLEQRTKFDLEMLEATGVCNGIENYSRYLTGRAPGEPPPRCSNISLTMPLFLPMNPTFLCPKSAGCTKETIGVNLPWQSMVSGYRRAWITVPSSLRNGMRCGRSRSLFRPRQPLGRSNKQVEYSPNR